MATAIPLALDGGLKHTFWTDGYFACSVGNVSEGMLRKYIENQGKEGGEGQC